jgi:hypothetical protein
MDIDFVFYFNAALHFAAYIDTIHNDIGFNQSALTDVNGALPENFALKISVNPDVSVKNKLTDKLGALAQKSFRIFDLLLFFPHVFLLTIRHEVVVSAAE